MRGAIKGAWETCSPKGCGAVHPEHVVESLCALWRLDRDAVMYLWEKMRPCLDDLRHSCIWETEHNPATCHLHI